MITRKHAELKHFTNKSGNVSQEAFVQSRSDGIGVTAGPAVHFHRVGSGVNNKMRVHR